MISVLSSLVLNSSGTVQLTCLYIFYSILHVQNFLCWVFYSSALTFQNSSSINFILVDFLLEKNFFWFSFSLSPYSYYWAFINVLFHFNSSEEFNILALNAFVGELHIWKRICLGLPENPEKLGIATSGCEWSSLAERRRSDASEEIVF